MIADLFTEQNIGTEQLIYSSCVFIRPQFSACRPCTISWQQTRSRKTPERRYFSGQIFNVMSSKYFPFGLKGQQ